MRLNLIIGAYLVTCAEAFSLTHPISIPRGAVTTLRVEALQMRRFRSIADLNKRACADFILPSVSGIGQDNDEVSSNTRDLIDLVKTSFLIAGTTIGGGFLALPTVVAPCGFYPAAISLFGVWFYFLAQSFALVECINRAKIDSEVPPTIASISRTAFGSKGEAAIGILLTILIQATLVSQIARAGMLFFNYRLGCLASAFSIAALVFAPRSGVRMAANANAGLTTLFLLSCISVFSIGVGSADFSLLSASNNWSMMPSALPSFLQLLCYGEIISTVCEISNYNAVKTKKAIVLGSFMTLCLQLTWSALGIALTPASSTIDAVSALIQNGGPVKLPLLSLSVTAILTTILGSYLALLSTVNEWVDKFDSRKIDKESAKGEKDKNNILKRIKVGALISIPATLIASTSPSVFLAAIDFCGSYPVLSLWGIVPPVVALIQRSKEDKNERTQSYRSAGPSIWLAILAAFSVSLVGYNAIDDLSSVFAIFQH